MNPKQISKLFDIAHGGYLILSRNAVQHLLEQIEVHDKATLYCLLLQEAHYGEPDMTEKGVLLHRGEVCISPQALTDFTHWKKSKLYSLLEQLEKDQLLVRLGSPGKGHYLLTMYEEHCGRSARKEEHTRSVALQESQSEKTFEEFFGYYLFITKTKEVDKEKARREWSRLSLADRREALQNVARYKDAVTKSEHLKLACNYLKDKSFKF